MTNVSTQSVVSAVRDDSASSSWLDARWTKWAAAAFGSVAAIGCWFVGFAGDTHAAERTRLAGMPASERAVFSEHAKVFQTLSANQQAAVKQVAAHVEKQDGVDRNRTEAGIEAFVSWTQQLSLSEYESVTSARSAEERIRIVEEILRHQQDNPEQSVASFWNGRSGLFDVSHDQFVWITEELEEATGREIETQRPALLRTYESLADAVGETGDPLKNLLEVITPKVSQNIFAFFEQTNPLTDRIQRVPEPVQPLIALQMISRAIDSERQRLLSEVQVTPSDLQQKFASLSASEQDRLLALSADDFQSQIEGLTTRAKAYGSDDVVDPERRRRLERAVEEARREMRRRFAEFGFRPKNGARDDNRRPDDRRWGGDRGPRGERRGEGPRSEGPRGEGPRANDRRPEERRGRGDFFNGESRDRPPRSNGPPRER